MPARRRRVKTSARNAVRSTTIAARTLECGGCTAPDVCGMAGPNVCGAECESDRDCGTGTWCDADRGRCTAGCRTGAAFVVDVPRVAIDLRFTLGGGTFPPVMAQRGAPGPWVVLRERGGAGEAEIHLYPSESGAGQVLREYAPPGGVQLVPGEYDVLYEARLPWEEAVAFDAGSLTVPSEPATITVDLAPPPPASLEATFHARRRPSSRNGSSDGRTASGYGSVLGGPRRWVRSRPLPLCGWHVAGGV